MVRWEFDLMAKKLTTAQFVERAKAVHGDKYDYSKVEYVRAVDKVEIICPKHGSFWQQCNIHYTRSACPKCAILEHPATRTSTTKEFIEKATSMHGDKYDYSKVEYTNSKVKVEIICPKHGSFWQIANDHTQGRGCTKCGVKLNTIVRVQSIDHFLTKARKIHGDKYNYSKAEYFNSHTKIKIICKTHGEFMQTPDTHYQGCGCPNCHSSQSKLELEILDFIKYNYGGTIIEQDREVLDGQELDIYLPDKNLAFEVNSYYTHWFQASEKHPYADATIKDQRGYEAKDGYVWGKRADYHQQKFLKCKAKGVRLIQIWDFYWWTISHHYKDMILANMGCFVERIYARKCDHVVLEKEEAIEFFKERSFHGSFKFNKNHQYEGLEYNGDLVMAVAWTPKTADRMVTAIGVRVIGGVSRLLKQCPKGMTYFTTNDSGSSIDELPYFKKVEYNKRRGFLIKNKSSKIIRDIWINKTKALKLEPDLDQEVLAKPNGQWNSLCAMGWHYVADSGITKFVHL